MYITFYTIKPSVWGILIFFSPLPDKLLIYLGNESLKFSEYTRKTFMKSWMKSRKNWFVQCFSSTWCYCGCFLSSPGCVTQSCDAGRVTRRMTCSWPPDITGPLRSLRADRGTLVSLCLLRGGELNGWTAEVWARCESYSLFSKGSFLTGLSFFLVEHFLRVTATWC